MNKRMFYFSYHINVIVKQLNQYTVTASNEKLTIARGILGESSIKIEVMQKKGVLP